MPRAPQRAAHEHPTQSQSQSQAESQTQTRTRTLTQAESQATQTQAETQSETQPPAQAGAEQEQVLPRPWGRLERILLPSAREANHLSLYRATHNLGRSDVLSDIVFKQQYFSRRHCSVTLKAADPGTGEATVVIKKHSKYGFLFVNKKPLAFLEEAQLRPGSIVHFSEPDVRSAIPHAYRFQILPEGLTETEQKFREELRAMQPKTRGAARKRTCSQALATESQGSAQESDGMPVAARTRSQPEKKRQRRGSTEPEPEQEAQSENVDTSNVGMTLRSKTPSPHKPTLTRPSPKAAGKKRRRLDASQVQDDEDDDAPDTLQNLSAKQLKLAHENAIHKQQVSRLRRELQQLRERFESEQRAQEQVLLSKEDLVGQHQREILALKEASRKRDAEIKAEQDRTNAEKNHLAASLDARTNRLNVVEAAHRELEQEYAKLKAERVANVKEIHDLKKTVARQDRAMRTIGGTGQGDRATLARRFQEAEAIKMRYLRKQHDFDVFIMALMNRHNEQTQSSESSEESPSVLAAWRASQESSAGNEHSPDTPAVPGAPRVAAPNDGPLHMGSVRDDEFKAGSSQELTQTQSQSQSQSQPLSQSQSESQSQPLSQDLSSYITGPYRGRSTRRLLSTSPDEEIKRQQ